MEFKAWPKIPRVENRKEYYTEKIDGTNVEGVVIYEHNTQSYWKAIINK